MGKKLDIHQVHPGMVIVKVTKQNGPVKIKKSGLVTSQEMLQGLIEMGVCQVEIDPEQTVEVQQSNLKKSPTQKMLENNQRLESVVNGSAPGQFHHSLFLSSAQDITPPWLFYSKRYMLKILIVLGGLGLGYTLANYGLIIEMIGSNANQIELVKAPQAYNPEIESEDTPPRSKNTPSQSHNQEPELDLEFLPEQTSQPSTTLSENSQASLPEEPAEQVTTAITPKANISPELLQRFEQALEQVDVAEVAQPIVAPDSQQKVPRIDQLPAWVMTRLPSMAFSAHMYASNPSERWVRVNGTRMIEGDKIDGSIEIIRIEPQHVILNFSGQTFSMAALTDW